MKIAAAIAVLLAIAVPVIAQERACTDERDALRVLARNLTDEWLAAQARLADLQQRESKLRAEIEATKPKPLEKAPAK